MTDGCIKDWIEDCVEDWMEKSRHLPPEMR
jgi:hypothetical protein